MVMPTSEVASASRNCVNSSFNTVGAGTDCGDREPYSSVKGLRPGLRIGWFSYGSLVVATNRVVRIGSLSTLIYKCIGTFKCSVNTSCDGSASPQMKDTATGSMIE